MLLPYEPKCQSVGLLVGLSVGALVFNIVHYISTFEETIIRIEQRIRLKNVVFEMTHNDIIIIP